VRTGKVTAASWYGSTSAAAIGPGGPAMSLRDALRAFAKAVGGSHSHAWRILGAEAK